MNKEDYGSQAYEDGCVDRERLDLLERNKLEWGEVRLEIVAVADTSVSRGAESRAERGLCRRSLARYGHSDGSTGGVGKVDIETF